MLLRIVTVVHLCDVLTLILPPRWFSVKKYELNMEITGKFCCIILVTGVNSLVFVLRLRIIVHMRDNFIKNNVVVALFYVLAKSN